MVGVPGGGVKPRRTRNSSSLMAVIDVSPARQGSPCALSAEDTALRPMRLSDMLSPLSTTTERWESGAGSTAPKGGGGRPRSAWPTLRGRQLGSSGFVASARGVARSKEPAIGLAVRPRRQNRSRYLRRQYALIPRERSVAMEEETLASRRQCMVVETRRDHRRAVVTLRAKAKRCDRRVPRVRNGRRPPVDTTSASAYIRCRDRPDPRPLQAPDRPRSSPRCPPRLRSHAGLRRDRHPSYRRRAALRPEPVDRRGPDHRGDACLDQRRRRRRRRGGHFGHGERLRRRPDPRGRFRQDPRAASRRSRWTAGPK